MLLGWAPEGFNSGTGAVHLTELAAPRVAPGLPSELLTSCPYLPSAEAQLATANANIAAARAALLSSIQLAGFSRTRQRRTA
jgi:multidrug efflux system outer membrane protein